MHACVCLSVCVRERCVCVIAVTKVAFFDISQNYFFIFNFIPLLQCLFLERAGGDLVFMRFAQVVTWSTSTGIGRGGRICGVEQTGFGSN